MQPPKITTENIELLRKTLDLKGVYTWDLQEEMIDLFSSKIEQQWLEHPTLSFQQALDAELSQYGRFDLMKLQDQLTEKLTKESYRDLWRQCKALFQLPTLIATLTSVVLIFGVLAKFGNVAKDTLLVIFMLSSLTTTALVVHRTTGFRKYQLAASIKLNSIFPLTNMVFVLLPNISHLTFEQEAYTSAITLYLTATYKSH